MFKEKNTKKRLTSNQNATQISTLDAKHQSMIQTFFDHKHQLQSALQEHEEWTAKQQFYEQQIESLKANDETDTAQYDILWTSNIYCKEKLFTLQRAIKGLDGSKEEIEYYENTANILFQYYDLLENQSSYANQTISLAPVRAVKGRKKLLPVASRSILEALQINRDDEEPLPSSENEPLQAASPVQMPSHPAPSVIAQGIDKSSLVDEYLAAIDQNYVRKKNYDHLGICEECNIPLTCLQQDGIMVCAECGYQELLLVEQNRPILRQPSKEASHFSYKRINHFREWCAQIQGKESTDIPEELFEKILGEIKKEKIHDTKKVTYAKMREILKKLGENKYYEHINYIINRINGVPTPHIPPELEEKLCNMFKEIQGPFLKHCPRERKNFLSYSYVLYKFFQILGLDEYLKYFSLLKSREKLYVQDQIFKHICKDLGWKFVPSL